MTTIPNPFEGIPQSEMIVLQTRIPRDLYDQIFHRYLPTHGTKNAVVGWLFRWFSDMILSNEEIQQTYGQRNEKIALEILNALFESPIDNRPTNQS